VKEQHRIETPEQRHARGTTLCTAAGCWSIEERKYHVEARRRLRSSEQAVFDLEFVKARAVAGVRPSVDLALAAMRSKLSQRLGAPTWRAG
jgi:hypothetical protein